MGRKTGVLHLSVQDIGNCKVVFIDGGIVSAWYRGSGALRNALLSCGLKGAAVSADDLTPPGVMNVVRSAGLPEEAESSAFEIIITSVVAKLSSVDKGEFWFEIRKREEIPEGWVWIESGIDPNMLALESARILDEGGGSAGDKVPEDFFDPIKVFAEETDGPSVVAKAPDGLEELKSMLFELHQPGFPEYVTLHVLRYAAVIMNRGVLFCVRDGFFRGIGEFGVMPDRKASAAMLSELKIPVEGGGTLSDVAAGGIAKKTSLNFENTWDRFLIEMLGGEEPGEVFVGPVGFGKDIFGLLYGDNLHTGAPIGDTAPLEIFLSQAGLAMGKALGRLAGD